MRTAVRTSTLVTAITMLVALVGLSTTSLADAGPVKLVPTTHYGYRVDKTTGQNVCSIGGTDECQTGTLSEEPGGFEYAEGVAASPTGNIYVANTVDRRVEELTVRGEFLLMFGKEVNATTHGDVCTAEEVKNDGVRCKKGIVGSGFDTLAVPRSIAVDPTTENVYVQDWKNWRIDEYTSDGQFILTIGKEVNATKDGVPGATEEEKNVCRLGEVCQAGVESSLESKEKGAFDFEQGAGDLLTVANTPEHLLYVGDAHRIQEFSYTGEWKGEVPLPSTVTASSPTSSITALAVTSDGQTAYIGYNRENVIRRLDLATGAESGVPITVIPRQSGNNVAINGLAINAAGQLAVASLEEGAGVNALREPFGLLINASTEEIISTYAVPDATGLNSYTPIAFDAKSNLYMVVITRNELLRYAPLPIAEVSTDKAACIEGPEQNSSITYNCTLTGTVNPYNVPDTEAFFEWGRAKEPGVCPTPEFDTALQQVRTEEALLPVEAQIEGLRPNQTFCFDEVGIDENVRLPEEIIGKKIPFSTQIVPPRTVGRPNALFITFDSAVIRGELNPENAQTEYFFEYAAVRNAGEKPLAECPGLKLGTCHGVEATARLESALYGKVGSTSEVVGLDPSTTYAYRLDASNDAGESTVGTESTFTTVAAPSVEAVTFMPSSVGSTSVVATGTVSPDGQQATYSFELGVYEGEHTHYSTVTSGSTGTNVGPETESANLTDLQPSTTYAYRIAISSGYGEAYGLPAIFTTGAVSTPTVFPPVAFLNVPTYEFPRRPVTCKSGYTLSKAGQCVKSKTKGRKATKKHKKGKKAKAKHK